MRLTGSHALLVATTVALDAGPAIAHADGSPISPADLWHHWSLDPFVLAPLVLACSLYAQGLWRLWSRAGCGHGIPLTRAGLFALGIATLVLALGSPLDPLGETLLTAHMIQHALLIGVAPPLIVAGSPAAASAWVPPAGMRQRLFRSTTMGRLRRTLAWFVRPIPAAALHGAVLWIWHAPDLFQLALREPWLHRLEHVAFFVTAMMFWQAVALAGRGAAAAPAGIAAGFGTMLHGSFLSALVTFAPQPLYPWYAESTAGWGLDVLADQQLAGLVMGVPLTAVYLVACLALVSRLLIPTRMDPMSKPQPEKRAAILLPRGSLGRPSSLTASRRISRTSSSMLRPWRAARCRSRAFTSSSKLRTTS